MQTIMAFDFGTFKTGIAIGNTLTFSARPLDTLTHDSLKPDLDEIATIIDEWQPQTLLVGLPINLDGTESDFCRSCRKFAGRLKHHFNLTVLLYNEQLSSNEAEAMLKSGQIEFGKKIKNFNNKDHQKMRDKLAAQIILQRYLDDLSLGRDNSID